MTTEQAKAYEAWWSDPASQNSTKAIFVAGWEAAQVAHTAGRLSSYALGKADERAEIERKLLAMAGHAFIAGKDDHAHWFRSLVNVLFKKPGDTSA